MCSCMASLQPLDGSNVKVMEEISASYGRIPAGDHAPNGPEINLTPPIC